MANAYSQPRQYADYIDPINTQLIGQALMQKQQLYDAGYTKLQQQVSQVASLDLIRPEDQAHLQDNLKVILETINNAGGLDFSSIRVTGALERHIGNAVDETVMIGYRGTKLYRQEQAEIEKLRKEKPDSYHVMNHNDQLEAFHEWYNSPKGTVYKGSKYVPYKNITKEIIDGIIKSKDFFIRETGYTRGLGSDPNDPFNGYYLEDVNQKVVDVNKLGAYIQAKLPDYAEQIRINAKYSVSGYGAEDRIEDLKTKVANIDVIISNYEELKKQTGSDSEKEQIDVQIALAQAQKSGYTNTMAQYQSLISVASPEERAFYDQKAREDLYRENLLGNLLKSYGGELSNIRKIKKNDVYFALRDLEMKALKMQNDMEIARMTKSESDEDNPRSPISDYTTFSETEAVDNKEIKVKDVLQELETSTNDLFNSIRRSREEYADMSDEELTEVVATLDGNSLALGEEVSSAYHKYKTQSTAYSNYTDEVQATIDRVAEDTVSRMLESDEFDEAILYHMKDNKAYFSVLGELKNDGYTSRETIAYLIQQNILYTVGRHSGNNDVRALALHKASGQEYTGGVIAIQGKKAQRRGIVGIKGASEARLLGNQKDNFLQRLLLHSGESLSYTRPMPGDVRSDMVETYQEAKEEVSKRNPIRNAARVIDAQYSNPNGTIQSAWNKFITTTSKGGADREIRYDYGRLMTEGKAGKLPYELNQLRLGFQTVAERNGIDATKAHSVTLKRGTNADEIIAGWQFSDRKENYKGIGVNNVSVYKGVGGLESVYELFDNVLQSKENGFFADELSSPKQVIITNPSVDGSPEEKRAVEGISVNSDVVKTMLLDHINSLETEAKPMAVALMKDETIQKAIKKIEDGITITATPTKFGDSYAWKVEYKLGNYLLGVQDDVGEALSKETQRLMLGRASIQERAMVFHHIFNRIESLSTYRDPATGVEKKRDLLESFVVFAQELINANK